MTEIHKTGNLDLLDGKVAVLGYGSQGHAHALNLSDSGVDVVVGLRENSPSWAAAEEAGLAVATVADAVKNAQLVAFLVPDGVQPSLYEEQVAPNLAAIVGGISVLKGGRSGFGFDFMKTSVGPDSGFATPGSVHPPSNWTPRRFGRSSRFITEAGWENRNRPPISRSTRKRNALPTMPGPLTASMRGACTFHPKPLQAI